MSCHQRTGNREALHAIAAITGQSVVDADAYFHEIKKQNPDRRRATREEVTDAIGKISTRLGLAPAVTPKQADLLREQLRSTLTDSSLSVTRSDLGAWALMVRSVPEHIPTIDRSPVAMPPMPPEQTKLWRTLQDLGAEHNFPWVIVGGQMTYLHALENELVPTRSTNDIDIVLGVWTRRDALDTTSRFLRDHGFEERRTSDGYGYRFHTSPTSHSVVDVMMPEGIHTQEQPPTTKSGRPGFSTEGGSQALTRAERVPVTVDGHPGYVLRPNLLGALVIKAHAHTVDSRDNERHCEDMLTLASIALDDPRSVAEQSRPGDRKAIRKFVRHLDKAGESHLATRHDGDAIYSFLSRLANSET